MEYITSGMIHPDYTRTFLKYIKKNEGYLKYAAGEAHEKTGLNWAASREENDSWYEAVAQYKEHYGNVTF